MPVASLLLSLIGRLLRLIPPHPTLLPALPHPPAAASRLSPLALRLPSFVIHPLAFPATPSNRPRPDHRPENRPPATHRDPVAPAPAAIQSSCPNAPQITQESIPPRRTRHSGALSRNRAFGPLPASAEPICAPPYHPPYPRPQVSIPTTLVPQSPPNSAPPCHPPCQRPRVSTPTSLAPQSHQKSAPPQPKSFLEKTLIAREAPKLPPRQSLSSASRPSQSPSGTFTGRNHPSALRIPAPLSPTRCPMSDFRAVVITDSSRDRGGPSHGLHRTFDRSSDVEVVALADPSDDHRDRWLKESGAATGYADYRDMLAAESPDIAIIAIHRYHQGRLQTFLDTIAAGVKGVVIEKPIAAQPAHADQMIAAADAAGARVVLAHRGRENPAIREAKRQADTGKWGPLIQIKARGKGDHRCGVVDALVLGTHELNTMLYFAEANPISCWGTVLLNGAPAQLSDAMDDEMYESGPQAGDRIFAEYTFPNGIIGSYESLPIGNGSNSGHALGCDLFFQNAVVTTRSKPDAEIHIFPEGDIFPQAEVGAWQPLLPDGWTPPAGDIAAPYWADWPGRESTACSNRSIGAELVRCLRENTAPVYASGIHDAAIVVDMIIGPQRSHLEGRRLALPLESRGNPWEG